MYHMLCHRHVLGYMCSSCLDLLRPPAMGAWLWVLCPVPGQSRGKEGTGPRLCGSGGSGPASPQDACSHLLCQEVTPRQFLADLSEHRAPWCVRPAQDRTLAGRHGPRGGVHLHRHHGDHACGRWRLSSETRSCLTLVSEGPSVKTKPCRSRNQEVTAFIPVSSAPLPCALWLGSERDAGWTLALLLATHCFSICRRSRHCQHPAPPPPQPPPGLRGDS